MALGLVAACGSDGGTCITVPGCLPGRAATITVSSSATNAPLRGVSITINGDAANALQCDSSCLVWGGAGKYVLDISAAGFKTVQQTIVVTSAEKKLDVYGPDGYEGKSCACDVVNTQQLAVRLDPAP